jgi:hypothetical protein
MVGNVVPMCPVYPEIVEWLKTVDEVRLTSRCFHGMAWNGSRKEANPRHLLVSSAVMSKLFDKFGHEHRNKFTSEEITTALFGELQWRKSAQP